MCFYKKEYTELPDQHTHTQTNQFGHVVDDQWVDFLLSHSRQMSVEMFAKLIYRLWRKKNIIISCAWTCVCVCVDSMCVRN